MTAEYIEPLVPFAELLGKIIDQLEAGETAVNLGDEIADLAARGERIWGERYHQMEDQIPGVSIVLTHGGQAIRTLQELNAGHPLKDHVLPGLRGDHRKVAAHAPLVDPAPAPQGETDLRPSKWFTVMTDGVLTPSVLRRAVGDGRIAGEKRNGRWHYSVASVVKVYSDFGPVLTKAYESARKRESLS